MKIFAVTADIELTKKPAWLDDFRNRFDKPYKYHVTLKQPCSVDESATTVIKEKLNDFFSNLTVAGPIELSFNTLKVAKDAPGGICIMLNSSEDEQIRTLQKQIIETLQEYSDYYKEKYEEYEKNFEAHITIARDLSEEDYIEASKELDQDYKCEGRITKIILTVMNNKVPEESNDPENQTVYNL